MSLSTDNQSTTISKEDTIDIIIKILSHYYTKYLDIENRKIQRKIVRNTHPNHLENNNVIHLGPYSSVKHYFDPQLYEPFLTIDDVKKL
jgi:hypothetical protein